MNQSEHSKKPTNKNEVEKAEVIDRAIPLSTKTPFYQASNAHRYQRQAIIKEIQKQTGRKIICFLTGMETLIERDDTLGFVDLLHNVEANQDLDLLIHTSGGDIDAAEKLIKLVRTKVHNGVLRIIIPDFAKSAGTLMALGADFIVMSDTSELGPIDPQIVLADGKGNRIRHSVQSYLDAYEKHSETLRNNPTDVPAQIMLNKLDPATVKLFKAVRTRARKFAEEQLKLGMFKNGGNWSLAASALIDTTRWLSHGQMISWRDAQHESIGLVVEYMSPDDDIWQQFWQLYCLQRLAFSDDEKLFESDYVSLIVDGKTS